MTTTKKKLIDVVPGERVIGIGLIESAVTDKEVTTLVVRNMGMPANLVPTDEALSTFVWKSSQIVDIGEADG